MNYLHYPNIELLACETQKLLSKDKYFIEKIETKKKIRKVKNINPEFIIYAFPQMWGSTAMGMDVSEDGRSVISCDAMTYAYTTVLIEQISNIAVVFCNGTLCYKVDEPNARFYDDLKHENILLRSHYKEYETNTGEEN